jgi:hypothetical protein
MLYEIIITLGKRERKSLTEWVAAPVFNRRAEVSRLCGFLCQHLPSSEDKHREPESGIGFDKVELYAQVFENKSFIDPALAKNSTLDAKKDAALRYIHSYLLDTVKQWLAWRDWSGQTHSTNLHLCRQLRKKGLFHAFEKTFAAFQNVPMHSNGSAAYFLHDYQLQFEVWEARHHQGETSPSSLRNMSQSFGTYVMLTALRHGCAALDKPNIGFSPEEIDFLPETLRRIETGNQVLVPAVQIYYHCFRLMRYSENDDFQALKTLLAEQSEIFPPEEIRDVWMVAINYCIRRLNAGERAWVHEAFDLYREGLARRLILDHGRLSKATYQNIMLLAIASDAWDWARRFLDDYRSALAPGERHNAYHFNLALWHFRQKSYNAAQEILLRVEFRDVHYNLDARRMMVRIYHDSGAFDALDSLLHSFKTYLTRHRNIGYHRDLNLNFVRMVQRIISLDPGNSLKRESLRQRIQTEKYLAERQWLLDLIGGR